MTTDRVVGAYLRGRLFIAGVGPATPVSDVLDVLTVIVMDTPGEALRKWRDGLDRASLIATAQTTRAPDRATWGLAPDQVAATQRLMGLHHGR